MTSYEFSLSNPNATESTKRVMKVLKKIAGNGIMTAQQNGSNKTTQLDRIYELTGKYPAVVGFDFLSIAKGDEPYLESADEIRNNINSVDTAIKWAKEHDCIVTYSWHWCSPTGYTNSHSFYKSRTTFNLVTVMEEKGEDYRLLMEDIDRVAVQLKKLADADIPVLWRPLHESNGSHFWWGAFAEGQDKETYTKGAAACKELYITMYKKLTEEHGLNNLIWVWNGEFDLNYPGDEYVDISGIDTYVYGLNTEKGMAGDLADEYAEFDKFLNYKKPQALTEISCVPDMKALSESRVPWLWFLLWNNYADNAQVQTTKAVYDAYNHPYAVSEDELSLIFKEVDAEK